jgi:hypothetical protein
MIHDIKPTAAADRQLVIARQPCGRGVRKRGPMGLL